MSLVFPNSISHEIVHDLVLEADGTSEILIECMKVSKGAFFMLTL